MGAKYRIALSPWLCVPALVAPVHAAYAVQYLSITEAQQIFFGAHSSSIEEKVVLSQKQRTEIEKISGKSLEDASPKIWRIEKENQLLGYLVVDNVIGKHDYITFAVGLEVNGLTRGVEILEYRENYGAEVRDPLWRTQFVGKKIEDTLALGKDVRNISGATFSAKHVTEGVRKVLALYKVLYGSHPN